MAFLGGSCLIIAFSELGLRAKQRLESGNSLSTCIMPATTSASAETCVAARVRKVRVKRASSALIRCCKAWYSSSAVVSRGSSPNCFSLACVACNISVEKRISVFGLPLAASSRLKPCRKKGSGACNDSDKKRVILGSRPCYFYVSAYAILHLQITISVGFIPSVKGGTTREHDSGNAQAVSRPAARLGHRLSGLRS